MLKGITVKRVDISDKPEGSTNQIFHALGFEKYHDDDSGKSRKHVFVKAETKLSFGHVSAAEEWLDANT